MKVRKMTINEIASKLRKHSAFQYVQSNERFKWIRFTYLSKPFKVRYELYDNGLNYVLFNKTDNRYMTEFIKGVFTVRQLHEYIKLHDKRLPTDNRDYTLDAMSIIRKSPNFGVVSGTQIDKLEKYLRSHPTENVDTFDEKKLKRIIGHKN